MIDAGRKNQRVTFQVLADPAQQNEVGEQTSAWADVVTLWAQVEPLRGREYFAAGQMQSVADVRIRVDYRSDLVETMRAVWRGVPHEIVAIINVDGAREQLEIMAVQGVRDGR